MTNSPNSDSTPHQSHIEAGSSSGVMADTISGSFVIGSLTIIHSNTISSAKAEETSQNLTNNIGANPYQGLRAFQERDSDRFFGRNTLIKELWWRFQNLHVDPKTIRILPIYGASGSGKSSLALAGLIPEIGQHPFPGRNYSRVAVLNPGTHPLKALAIMLAKFATGDSVPAQKALEFENILWSLDKQENFHGLHHIACNLPEIANSPLIILVDQFEEVYTLDQDNNQESDAFVENLLCAASDHSQYVSVIITMRSDFLGKTHQHPRLNKLFSSQGLLVPIMQVEELQIAITEPAKRAGYEFDKVTVNRLIRESKGKESALPLLQFALYEIWEKRREGVEPAETLDKLGGVGGALAKKAKETYDSLEKQKDKQKIARQIFLELIQINENNEYTRRRVPIAKLTKPGQDPELIRSVIGYFAKTGEWILITSLDKQEVEIIEIAHEVLINEWQDLKTWLGNQRENLIKKRKIEQAAEEWQQAKNPDDYLFEKRRLRDAQEFIQDQKDNSEIALSSLATKFVRVSEETEINNKRIEATNKFKSRLKIVFFVTILIAIPSLSAFHFQRIDRAKAILSRNNCNSDPEIKGLLEYMWWTGNATRLRDVQLCNEDLRSLNIPKVVMPNSNLERANLAGANLRGSTLVSSNLSGVFMFGANFSGSLLMDTDFRCVKGKCADLSDANFRNAILVDAKLQGAILKNSDFRGSNLTDADLSDTKDLTAEQLKGAILCRTKMPSYLNTANNCP